MRLLLSLFFCSLSLLSTLLAQAPSELPEAKILREQINQFIALGQQDSAQALLPRYAALQSKDPRIGIKAKVLQSSIVLQTDADEAEKILIEARKQCLQQFSRDTSLYIEVIFQLCWAYERMQKYEISLSMLEEIISIYQRNKDEENETYFSALTSAGNIYRQQLQQYQKAYPLLQEAERIGKKLYQNKKISNLSYSNALLTLGLYYTDTKKFDQAEKYLVESVNLRTDLGKEHPRYLNAYSNLGTFYSRIGKREKALEIASYIVEVKRRTYDLHNPDRLRTLTYLARELTWFKRWSEAENILLEALRFNAKGDTSQLSWNNFKEQEYRDYYVLRITIQGYQNLLQQHYKDSQDSLYLRQALKAMQDFLWVTDQMRQRAESSTDKSWLFSNANQHIHTMIQAGLQLDGSAFDAQAFSLIEQQKALLLLEATQTQKARRFGYLPDSLIQRETALEQRLSKAKKQEYEAKNASDRQKAQNAYNEAIVELRQWKEMLAKQFPKYYAAKYAPIQTEVQAIQALLDAETAFLSYLVTDTAVYIHCLSQKSQQLHFLPLPAAKRDSLIKTLRKCLSDFEWIQNSPKEAYSLYTQTAHELYQTLVAPALKNLKAKHLIFALDGELGHLPFEALLSSPAKGQDYRQLDYLLRHYRISYNYSAAFWKESRAAARPRHNGKLFGMAGSYGQDSARAVRAPKTVERLRQSLSPLPAAQTEVKALAQQFKGDFFWGDEANETRFKQQAKDYAVVHLAMHGILNKKNPLVSSIAFSMGKDSTDDSLLEAWEISHLELNAALVVLSACETGYGQFQRGEGVLSLARSFLYAGVPALVVSLWQVNDASTSILMPLFYQNLAQGQDKAEALRQAKLHYLSSVDDPAAAHPAYWAAFVQIGDAQAIELSGSGGSWLSYALVGGLGLLLLGGLFYWKRK
jgi:CHAT domain-containing protein